MWRVYESSMKEIKVLSFDADNTLWDFQKVMRHSLNQTLLALKEIDPIAHSALTVDKMIAIRNAVAENLKGIIINLEEIRLNAFRQTLASVNRANDELASYLHEIYMKHRFEDIELYEDVVPTLEKLKEKFKLIIISNANTYPKKCGLDNFFDEVFFAQDIGVEKPDPRAFTIALDEIGYSKNQVLHIGDSLYSDIFGANNADIKCAWLNREKIENTTEYKADFEITTLKELLDILL